MNVVNTKKQLYVRLYLTPRYRYNLSDLGYKKKRPLPLRIRSHDDDVSEYVKAINMQEFMKEIKNSPDAYIKTFEKYLQELRDNADDLFGVGAKFDYNNGLGSILHSGMRYMGYFHFDGTRSSVLIWRNL
jgi:hypothetical protein